MLQTAINSRQVLLNEKQKLQLLAEERLKEIDNLSVVNSKLLMKLAVCYSELERRMTNKQK
jgi:hypothetical protein